MRRIELILKHPVFVETLENINSLEENRIFCKHNLEHLLDVARIAALINERQELDEKKYDIEIIYAMALLHDIGRELQYKMNIPHEEGSRQIALHILDDCGFNSEEIKQIIDAILCHNKLDKKECTSLGKILYTADKKSRTCFNCEAYDKCKWLGENKNNTILY